MAKKWTAFPHASQSFAYDSAAIRKHWPRLHRGDYTVYTSPAGLDRALTELRGLPGLIDPPGAWHVRAGTPAPRGV